MPARVPFEGRSTEAAHRSAVCWAVASRRLCSSSVHKMQSRHGCAAVFVGTSDSVKVLINGD